MVVGHGPQASYELCQQAALKVCSVVRMLYGAKGEAHVA